MAFSAIQSASAARRLSAARAFLDALPSHHQLLIVGASRGAADDFAREIALARGATFGLYRFSLTQLAARFATPVLSGRRAAPATALAVQAVSARALFEAARDNDLTYFRPVADTPGFPRALARTLEEIALTGIAAGRLAAAGGGGRDLATLLERFEQQFEAAHSVDRAAFFAAAVEGVTDTGAPYPGCHVLLLDTAVLTRAEEVFVSALIGRAPSAFGTVPDGDAVTARAFGRLGPVQAIDTGPAAALDRVRRQLFAPTPPPPGEPLAEVELFSAPGEGREAIEIARRVLREARAGVAFDRMAIALRAPAQYAGLLEHALARAGVPAYFDRGTRRPHPAGRAFLALLTCAAEGLTAARFAEYLSLGQVPREPRAQAAVRTAPASSDEVFGALAERQEMAAGAPGAPDPEEGRIVRAPWKWERLLAESRVVASEERWTRRLGGLTRECELQRRDLARREPDSPRIDHLARKIADLAALSAFALPIIRVLACWPTRATWSEWLDRFDELAPQVLRKPEHVLRVLADLRPMGEIGPIGLPEAAQVLSDRLATVEADPPLRRYGRVFVGSPAQLRGRIFDVVFVPALAERMFPQKAREDPLLLDAAREAIDAALATAQTRSDAEKLQLRLAVGAAAQRLYVSFPTVEVGEGRPRVPSLYALEVWRAMTGRVPSAEELQHAAARASQATLGWPAPVDAAEAIDPLEHDLATLRRLVGEPDERARGGAHYILGLNECLQRSVRERYMRGKRGWSHWDGLTRVTEHTAPFLARHRLGLRPYSLSALQKYASCPYQFLLSAIYRLRLPDDLDALQRLDPLTRGSLFHAAQSSFLRSMKAEGRLPLTPPARDAALQKLDEAVARVGQHFHELLAPAVERVWADELSAIRRDLRLWVDQLADSGGEWVPRWFEWSFGLSAQSGDAERDPESAPDPVRIDNRFILHGSIDLIEEHEGTGDLRVTDHKTGKYRGREGLIIDGGRVLQPVLYGLALEAAMHRPVAEGRLYYATTDGGYQEVRIPLTPAARRAGLEALEIVDRAVERGFLAPAPAERACEWCDFRPVCGPGAERRVSRYKAQDALADLLELRRRP